MSHRCAESCEGRPGGDGDLSESGEQDSRGKTDKGHNGPFQEVQYSNQNIGGLCTLWDLFHEMKVDLTEFKIKTNQGCRIIFSGKYRPLLKSRVIPHFFIIWFQWAWLFCLKMDLINILQAFWRSQEDFLGLQLHFSLFSVQKIVCCC